VGRLPNSAFRPRDRAALGAHPRRHVGLREPGAQARRATCAEVHTDFETWIATYRPVDNRHSPDFAEDNPVYLFEMFGDDLAFVERMRAEDPSLIWTLVEGDEGDWIIEGFHWMNRPAYLVATVPHTGGPVDVRIS
jgi:hypothetical protein